MTTRRRFLEILGAAGGGMLLAGCAISPALRRRAFPPLEGDDPAFLGLARSLPVEYDYAARIEGAVPSELRGTLYRNGPGLFDRAGLRKRCIMDGDGMIQSFAFGERGARFRSHFVRTRKFVEEEAAGHFIYPSWSTQAPGGLWGNAFKADTIQSEASVTVYHRNGALLAFDDTGQPWELDPETLETRGETRLGLAEGESIYSAHAKRDPITGEWFHFGVRYGPKPMLHLTSFGRTGAVKSHRVLPLPRYVYIHDWFVTEGHFVLLFHPVYFAFVGFLLGRRSMLDSLRWKPEKGNLVWVLPREGEGAPIALEAPARFMWHSINAFERDGEILADFIGYGEPDHFIGPDPAVQAIMQGRRGGSFRPGQPVRYRIDPGRKTLREEILDPGNAEWPRIDERTWCRPYRLAYFNGSRPGEFFWSTVQRFDTHSGRLDRFAFAEGQYCGEPVFVPRPGSAFASEAPSQPGWLLTEVYDGRTRKSFLAVLDAEHLADGPLARVHLEHHVPLSYHGWWNPA
jgi:all-trans-8'-apo-beta-carotenal 15,15'-oxygenase